MFPRIKRALDEEDIEGLLALGCPGDEYDNEAKLIEEKICGSANFGKKTFGPDDLAKIIEDVWDAQFGPFDETESRARNPHYVAAARMVLAERE